MFPVALGLLVLAAVVSSCAGQTRPTRDYPVQAGTLHRGPRDRSVLGSEDRDESQGHHPLRLRQGRRDRRAWTTSCAPRRLCAGKLSRTTSIRRIPFDDTDVYKVIEGAAYTLSVHPDKQLEAYVDDLIAKIGAAQEPDGYLYTARTIDPQASAPLVRPGALGVGRREQPRTV